MQMPHAVFHRRLGGPEVLEYAEVASADPAAGEVAVRIEAAGVNPIDAKLRSGLRASTPIEGRRGVGSDGAGIVLAVGDDVAGFRPGMPVVVSGAQGTYAEEAIVPASALTLRPPAVDAETGAAIGIPVATAYQALRSLAVGPGDRLLVHGGSGTVGQAVIQFAVRWDADVLATTSERRADRVRALGAVPVAYGPGLVERVRAAGTGIDVALDCAGTDEALAASVEVVHDRSRVATLVRGADAPRYGIQAYAGGAAHGLTDQQRAWRREAIPVALGLIAAGGFTIELGPRYALRDAVRAHEDVERGTNGKILLVPDQT
ncbi:NADP-dependent oxidoreductase [Microbacterium sp.]|uniref:quinone oxidoreductase family protein n=2 Tax=unclassified Microbacterium TaxID=2609290 RepID=UPI002580A677|nr:NADP-dependent oxidoreductase [Microbacterium sp.]|tara:strand:+ start:108 stop:1061 length:954 start_codon:yes stop_codon:yes gene_type:complete